MTKFFYKFFLAAFLSAVFSSPAYSKTTGGDADFEQSEDASYFPAIAYTDEGDDMDATIAELESYGIIVLRHRGNFILAYVPVDFNSSAMNSRRKARGGKSVRFESKYNRPSMDRARDYMNAALINEGKDLPQPFLGKGVVIGICDIGIDTRHVNFRTADGSECRIRRVVHYQEQQGLRNVYSTPEDIYEWQTDNSDEWHATHVTGIAAGACNENGMRSLAPEADIVFTASQLSDVGLLAGVEDIIEYAKEVGKPAVINLSMGNNLGPHDGSSLFTQYLDLCAEDAIICISAGNDGDPSSGTGVSHTFDFTAQTPSVSLRTTNWNGLSTTGIAQAWLADNRPVTMTLFLHYDTNAVEKNIDIKRLNFKELPQDQWECRISADPDDPDYDETFGAHFNSGYILIVGEVNHFNNRFNITVEIDCTSRETSPNSSSWAAYWPGIKLEGEPGQHVDFYAGAGIFLRRAYPDASPNNKMSISDLASGKRTVSVGMTVNKTIENYLDGTSKDRGFELGTMCPLSSYGTLLDGRVMPLTSAPGAVMVSSISSAFLARHSEKLPTTHSFSTVDDNRYYWAYETGTSMSCPFVVSAIATWLQADPSLTIDDVRAIIEATNASSYTVAGESSFQTRASDDPRVGQGFFNPYEGLKMVVQNSGSVGISSTELSGVDILYSNGDLMVANFGNPGARIAAYSLSGAKVWAENLPEGYSSFNLSGWSKGVYSVVIENREGFRKIVKLFVK